MYTTCVATVYSANIADAHTQQHDEPFEYVRAFTQVRQEMAGKTAFVPTNADFKKNLDVLMEKEYIERDPCSEGPPAYIYIA